MKIQIVYGTEHIVDVETADELSEKEVQDFLSGKLVLHGVDVDGNLLSYSGRHALWMTRTVTPTTET